MKSGPHSNSISASSVPRNAGTSQRLIAAAASRTSSTFSCDIALLRQPHDFEGPTGVQVMPSIHDLPVLERVHAGERKLDRRTAPSAFRGLSRDRHDSVTAGVDDLLGPDSQLDEIGHPGAQELSKSLPTNVRLRRAR